MTRTRLLILSIGLLALTMPGRAQLPTVLAPAPPLTAELRAKLDVFVPAAMAELKVMPGLSISIAKGGEVVYASGFGVADVDAKTRVTAETVFYTASLAKAFTGMAAAVLATQGKLDLDAPLTTFFPGFQLPPGADPKKATVRGLLAHDPGFGNATINYVTSFIRPYESETELVRVLNTYSQPLAGFAYANTNYALAAYIIEKATGQPWKDVVAELVFTPLGMTKTTAYMSRARDVARPYAAEAEGFVWTPLAKTQRTITGAGGVYSTASDLARFVQASLDEGRVDGRQALPAAAVRLVQTPITTLQATYTYYRRTGYGIGLYLGDYDGEPMLHHFGGITGYKAHLSYMPRRALGVVVLGNEGADGARFTDLVASYAYDLLLGKDADAQATQRIAAYKVNIDRARAQRAGPRAEWKRLRADPGSPALPLTAYTGTYRSERLGDLDLVPDGKRLVIHFGDLRGDALPVKDHEFLVSWLDGGPPQRWLFTTADARVTGFDWGGRSFTRVHQAAR